MTDKQILSENIRLRRLAKHWTQKYLADKIGLNQVTIGQIESGHRDPSLETLLAIAKALGVPVGDLFRKASVAS